MPAPSRTRIPTPAAAPRSQAPFVLLALVVLAAAGFVGSTYWAQSRAIDRLAQEQAQSRQALEDKTRAQGELIAARQGAQHQLSEALDTLRERVDQLEKSAQAERDASAAALKQLREALEVSRQNEAEASRALRRIEQAMAEQGERQGRELSSLRAEVAKAKTESGGTPNASEAATPRSTASIPVPPVDAAAAGPAAPAPVIRLPLPPASPPGP